MGARSCGPRSPGVIVVGGEHMRREVRRDADMLECADDSATAERGRGSHHEGPLAQFGAHAGNHLAVRLAHGPRPQ